jgi:FeS assembly protein IscX
MRWEHTLEIIEALEENYPDEDLDSIGKSEILDLVIELSEFDDSPEDVPDSVLKNILLRWSELREDL